MPLMRQMGLTSRPLARGILVRLPIGDWDKFMSPDETVAQWV